jgi:hypothetical protein
MRGYSGEFIAALLVAFVLSWAASPLVARRYRSAMRRLMAAMPPGKQTEPSARAAPPPSRPASVGLADNRRAGYRLTTVMVGLSCLIAITATWIWLRVAHPDVPRTPTPVFSMAVYYLWPVVPVVGLIWRWSRLRLLAGFLVWMAAAFAILLWRLAEPSPVQILWAFAIDAVPSFAVVTMVFFSGATRAVAPWLFLPFLGLSASVFAGLRLLTEAAEREAPWFQAIIAPLETLPSALGVVIVFVAFGLAPLMLAWWPLRRFGCALGRAYARGRLSELLVVFTAVWAVLLLGLIASTMDKVGWSAALVVAPLLWIPIVMMAYARVRTVGPRPPTLLVLRVFQRDRAARELFDRAIERWRLSGNTVLIAGTDLADRTLDADDIFTFLDGRLASRFVSTREDITTRIATFALAPDAEGRYRVNECYCYDSTWRAALKALIEVSDVALIDLRGFQLQNEGCRFELAALAHATGDLRVVMLTDGGTDQDAIREATAGGHAERFTRVELERFDRRSLERVLGALFHVGGVRCDA